MTAADPERWAKFRVVALEDGSWWIYRDDCRYCGPFPTLESALATVNYLEDGQTAYPTAPRQA
jgi:hypothetical protein